jgi:hypothetical protein
MKKLGANFDVRISINVKIMASRVSNWLAKFDGIFFFSLGANMRLSFVFINN